MNDQFEIETALIKAGAFQEKNPPVLGTSGLPLFYFVNTEKLLCDDGKWAEFGDSSSEMAEHVIECYTNPIFKQLSDYLVEQILIVAEKLKLKRFSISGFQRRDWPFSIIAAYLLKKKHISLYKNGRLELLNFGNQTIKIERTPHVENIKTIHISDLMTTGSSIINGWLPFMHRYKIEVQFLINIISRVQGGEDALKRKKIRNRSLFKIDEEFLAKYAQNPEACIAYKKNTKQTIIKYLKENGALAFLPYFNPKLGDVGLKRSKLFYEQWSLVLSNDQKDELEDAIIESYNLSREEIFF